MSERIKQQFMAAYDAYADAIYRHCYFRVYSKARAEELVQETFMKTWQYLENHDAVENIRAFLYRVATNLIIDGSRKKTEESLDALRETSDEFDPRGDSRDDMERALLLKDVLETMKQLPEDEREILSLRYVDDMDPKEIAVVLHITPNNASVRLNRAVKSLKAVLDQKSTHNG